MSAETINLVVDGAAVSYALRTLRDDESDIRRWAEFCAFCFKDKANPPGREYFERHFYNDPRRDASAIHIIEFSVDDGSAEIASSMRVFRRKVSDGDGGAMEAGGIGEVCTHPDHRRRGLSRILLTKCISFMEECGMETSLLHAAPDVTPVYKKNGNYDCSTSRWSAVTIFLSKLNSPDSVRLADFPADTKTLSQIHKVYSEDRFAGCVVRTEEYWNEYLSKEIGDSLFVLTKGDTVVAWLSIRPRGGRYQLREFGVKKDDVPVAQALSMLLHRALEKESCNEEIQLVLPTAVLDDVKGTDNGGADSMSPSYVEWESVQSEDDIGWMYRVIVKKEGRLGMVEVAKAREHLIWPADSF